MKYRAWHKKAKVMFHFAGMYTNSEYETLNFPCIGLVNGPLLEDAIEEFAVMASTGVFDINKKEAYYDDLVKLADGSIGRVSYVNGCTVAHPLFSLSSSMKGMMILGGVDFEIIGNVYENPELVESIP